MATDTLILGAVVFDGFSPPDRMMGGGKHALAVHKLPGGARVIDTLGPDEADITWSGHFFDDGALARALALDGMRQAGQPVPLIWGAGARLVIVSEFAFYVARFPMYVEYSITCVVQSLGGAGVGAVGGIASLVVADLASAIGL